MLLSSPLTPDLKQAEALRRPCILIAGRICSWFSGRTQLLPAGTCPPAMQLGPVAAEAYGSGLYRQVSSPVGTTTYGPAPEGEVRRHP